MISFWRGTQALQCLARILRKWCSLGCIQHPRSNQKSWAECLHAWSSILRRSENPRVWCHSHWNLNGGVFVDLQCFVNGATRFLGHNLVIGDQILICQQVELGSRRIGKKPPDPWQRELIDRYCRRWFWVLTYLGSSELDLAIKQDFSCAIQSAPYSKPLQ